ncbi:Aspartic proteinase CDR1 [Dendrobium catenatum]|uniref:Aspartic proteinase CDR1 n=1 Tax=Dendrobium catenatum TaxID=906689 RepID=A0A2I0X1V7_9ASPA|nr:Aspartic proteinase CDR1 [Dendrobium catenatum]
MKAAINAHQGNIIIDSGTPLTFIDNETVQSVANKVASSVSFPKVADPNGVFNLCLDVSGSGADAKLPDITFHFSGGAPVVLHEHNTFVEVAENTLCLAFISSDHLGVNIFGNIAQQNFHIGYDLNAMQLTVAPADCANMIHYISILVSEPDGGEQQTGGSRR